MPVREVFADTAGWANYFIRSEPFHSAARSLLIQARVESVRILTTNYILAELASLLISPLHTPRPLLIAILQAIRSASWVEVIHVDRTLDQEAYNLLEERTDKDWSLVDCASFAVMRRRGVSSALTSDHHFEQAGFVRLLK